MNNPPGGSALIFLCPRHCVIASWSSDEPPKELLEARDAQQLEAVPWAWGVGDGVGDGVGGLGGKEKMLESGWNWMKNILKKHIWDNLKRIYDLLNWDGLQPTWRTLRRRAGHGHVVLFIYLADRRICQVRCGSWIPLRFCCVIFHSWPLGKTGCWRWVISHENWWSNWCHPIGEGEQKHIFWWVPVPFHVLARFEMKILDALDAWIGCISMCIVEGCLDKIWQNMRCIMTIKVGPWCSGVIWATQSPLRCGPIHRGSIVGLQLSRLWVGKTPVLRGIPYNTRSSVYCIRFSPNYPCWWISSILFFISLYSYTPYIMQCVWLCLLLSIYEHLHFLAHLRSCFPTPRWFSVVFQPPPPLPAEHPCWGPHPSRGGRGVLKQPAFEGGGQSLSTSPCGRSCNLCLQFRCMGDWRGWGGGGEGGGGGRGGGGWWWWGWGWWWWCGCGCGCGSVALQNAEQKRPKDESFLVHLGTTCSHNSVQQPSATLRCLGWCCPCRWRRLSGSGLQGSPEEKLPCGPTATDGMVMVKLWPQ